MCNQTVHELLTKNKRRRRRRRQKKQKEEKKERGRLRKRKKERKKNKSMNRKKKKKEGKKERKRKAKVESNRRRLLYQPNGLPLYQTGSLGRRLRATCPSTARLCVRRPCCMWCRHLLETLNPRTPSSRLRRLWNRSWAVWRVKNGIKGRKSFPSFHVISEFECTACFIKRLPVTRA